MTDSREEPTYYIQGSTGAAIPVWLASKAYDQAKDRPRKKPKPGQEVDDAA